MSDDDKTEVKPKRFTVNRVITVRGRILRPGDEVPPGYLGRIDEEYLAPFGESAKPDQAKTEEDGQDWYKYQTVKSVLESVGTDPDRARYALERELDRPEDRQRAGVIKPLAAMLGLDDESEQAAGGGEAD